MPHRPFHHPGREFLAITPGWRVGFFGPCEESGEEVLICFALQRFETEEAAQAEANAQNEWERQFELEQV